MLADAPVVYWRLDELNGATAADSSGHAHNATYGAIIGYQKAGALVGDPDSGIDAGNTAAITSTATGLPLAATARTVEFWSTNTGCCGSAGMSYGNLAAGNGFSASYNGSQLSVTDGKSADNVTVPQPFGLSDGQWHLYDISFASSKVTFYVDGVAIGTGMLSGLATNAGGSFAAGSNGDIDDVAVYATALTPTRVSTHWTAGSSTVNACLTTPTGSYPAAVLADTPTSYYRADDTVTNPKGRVAYDASGNCHNGSIRYTDTSTTGSIVGDTDTAIAGAFSGSSTSLPAGATARTVEFWATATGCCGSFDVGYGNLANGNGFDIHYDGATLSVSDGSSSIAAYSVSPPYALNDQQWHLIDLSYNGGTAIFSVDGVAVGSGPLAGLTTDTNVGLSASSRTLDEIAVYPTALSASRIAAHWTAGSSTSGACPAAPTGAYPAAVLTDKPTSYYRAGDIATNAKGRVAYDSSGHCNNGSLRYTGPRRPAR